jgi:hypothetical protein
MPGTSLQANVVSSSVKARGSPRHVRRVTDAM